MKNGDEPQPSQIEHKIFSLDRNTCVVLNYVNCGFKDNLPADQTWWRNLPPLHVLKIATKITNEMGVSKIQLIISNIKAYQVVIKR